GFSFGPSADDDMRRRLTAGFDQLIDVKDKSAEEIADLARNLKVDIGVDLKGFTDHARTGIFAHRAAPIQVNYLGYPGTMGASYIDYIIADKILIRPEEAEFYSEKIAYLPHSYQVNGNRRQPVRAGAELDEQVEDALGHWPSEGTVAAKLGACVEGNEQRARV